MRDAARVEIDTSTCTGHGRCYELAPRVFTDDDRGYGQVRSALIDRELLREASVAEENCPERAILIERGSS